MRLSGKRRLCASRCRWSLMFAKCLSSLPSSWSLTFPSVDVILLGLFSITVVVSSARRRSRIREVTPVVLLLCVVVIAGVPHFFVCLVLLFVRFPAFLLGSKVGRSFVLTRFGGLSD